MACADPHEAFVNSLDVNHRLWFVSSAVTDGDFTWKAVEGSPRWGRYKKRSRPTEPRAGGRRRSRKWRLWRWRRMHWSFRTRTTNATQTFTYFCRSVALYCFNSELSVEETHPSEWNIKHSESQSVISLVQHLFKCCVPFFALEHLDHFIRFHLSWTGHEYSTFIIHFFIYLIIIKRFPLVQNKVQKSRQILQMQITQMRAEKIKRRIGTWSLIPVNKIGPAEKHMARPCCCSVLGSTTRSLDMRLTIWYVHYIWTGWVKLIINTHTEYTGSKSSPTHVTVQRSKRFLKPPKPFWVDLLL